MAKSVITIPATVNRHTAAPIGSYKKRRVAAYARVSTDHEEQQSSYETQVDYYTNYINGREDWEFVSVYADEGITGCNTKKRDGFNKMVEDALSGAIDLIITKSVSRFARNTVDSLTTIRKLKENRVECYFEKENIWTFDSKGELLLTIMSSLAQEESRSISENCTWGQRKRFADGKVTVPFKRFLGYDRGEDGNLVINEEQAETVRRIYGLFLQGRSPHAIAKLLTARHSGKNRAGSMGVFSGRIKCADCGGWYGSKVWHSNSKYRKTIWQCNHKFDGGEKCGTPHLDEETIKQLFLKAANAIFAEKDGVREDYDSIKDTLFGTAELETERLRLQEEMNVVAELIEQCVAENARVALDQTEYQKKYDGLAGRFNRAKGRLSEVSQAITERQAKREKIGRFVSALEKRDGPLTEFNEDDWYSLVEYATVYSREDIRFTFKNGMEIKA